MKTDPVRDKLILNACISMSAMRYVKEQIADVSDNDKLPRGLREAVQAITESYNYQVAQLVEWAKKVGDSKRFCAAFTKVFSLSITRAAWRSSTHSLLN